MRNLLELVLSPACESLEFSKQNRALIHEVSVVDAVSTVGGWNHACRDGSNTLCEAGETQTTFLREISVADLS